MSEFHVICIVGSQSNKESAYTFASSIDVARFLSTHAGGQHIVVYREQTGVDHIERLIKLRHMHDVDDIVKEIERQTQ